jgi:hypothetical protein
MVQARRGDPMNTSARCETAGPHEPTEHPFDKPRAPAWDSDARYISELAEQYVLELNRSSRQAPELGRIARVGRFLQRARQWFRRKGRELVQEHWDIGLFDVFFGSVKAFGIYPALYFAGLTWTIPIMEYLPLNTQLWTAGYLFCRGNLLSAIGRLRYGHNLNEMNKLRDEALRIDPRDVRSIHRFEQGDHVITLRIRRGRLRDWLRKLRGLARKANVVQQSELRKMVSDTEFLFQANELRNNAYLYEAILIKKVLGATEDPKRLTGRLLPEAPLDEKSRALRDLLGESLEPSVARVTEQGNSLTDTLKKNLGDKLSATSLALRWINWAYQRRTFRLLAQLDVLHYRLLAERLDGTDTAASALGESIRDQRRQIQTWMDAAAQFGERAKLVFWKAAAQEVIRKGIREAQAAGLKVRLARLAFWLSPSRKSN